jgi:ribosomal protein S18 acetylase RimI-like enzyme
VNSQLAQEALKQLTYICIMEIIEPATVDDAAALNVLINRAYRGESSKQGWTTEADLLDGTRTDEEGIAELIATPNTQLLKYVINGKLLGCVELRIDKDKLYLGMLTVDPSLQGKGIGKKLLEKAEKKAEGSGCTAVYMTVITDRAELIGWYGRNGYKDTGERKPFAFEHPRFGSPKKPLEFLVLEKKLRPFGDQTGSLKQN